MLTQNSEEYVKKKEYILNYIKKSRDSDDLDELESFLVDNMNFIKNDKEIAIATISIYPYFFDYFSDEIKDDEEIALVAIKFRLINFESVSDRLKSNKNFVLEAVKLDTQCYIVKYMSEELRNDEEIILQFIKNSERYIISNGNEGVERVFGYVGENLIKNRSFILKILKLESYTIHYIFDYMSEELRNDKEIAIAALKKSGSFISYLGEKLCDDEEFIMIAIRDIAEVIDFASDRLKKNKNFIIKALKYNVNIFPYISEELKDDEEIALVALKSKPVLFKKVGNRLKNNRNFILKVIKYDSSIFECIPETLKNDPEILLASISNGTKNDKLNQYINNYLGMTSVLDLVSMFDKPNKSNLTFAEAFMQKINYIQVENNKEQEQCVEYVETLFKFISAVENNEEPYTYLYKIQGSKCYSYLYGNINYQYVKTNMVSDELKNLLTPFEIIQKIIYSSKSKNITEYYIKNGYKILKDFLNLFDKLKDKLSLYDSMLFELMVINVLEQLKKLQKNIYKISTDEVEQGLEYLKSDFKIKFELMDSNKKIEEIEVVKDNLKL